MGHLINPISFRIGLNRFWDSSWFIKSNYNYNYLICEDFNIKTFLKKFFMLKLFIKHSILYSHCKIFRFSQNTQIYIYLFKSRISTIVKSELKWITIFLLSKFYNYFFPKFYQKILNFFDYYFNSLSNILLNINKQFVENKSNLSKYDLILIYLCLLLKKSRFKIINKILNFLLGFSIIKKGLMKKRNLMTFSFYKNNFLLKIILWFLRFKFWNKLSNFLVFFFKRLIPFNVTVKLCRINYLGVNTKVIGNYIAIRLKQRFQVLQIVSPIIKDLKTKNSILGFKLSFCGRFSRKEMATYEWFFGGSIPLSTKKAFIEYDSFGVILKDSISGIKLWLYHMDKNVKKLNYINSVNSIFWKFSY